MSDFVHDSIFKDAFLRASHHYIDALELPDIIQGDHLIRRSSLIRLLA